MLNPLLNLGMKAAANRASAAVLLVTAGGRALDAAVVRGDRAAAGDAVGARRVTEALVAANSALRQDSDGAG